MKPESPSSAIESALPSQDSPAGKTGFAAPATITNPILRGFNPDPSIVRIGDDYYIATSTFEWFPGVQIHHSRDLIHWQLLTRPLQRASQLNMLGNPDSCGVWAPCLTYAHGLFWLIYTDVKRYGRTTIGGASGASMRDFHNYLVTSPRIDGDWSDPVPLNSSGFDPSLFHEDDGRKYLLNVLWDHRPGNNRFAGIVLQEYSVPQRKLIGERKTIFTGTPLGFTEAPHLYKRNGWYYLLTAEGGTGWGHAVTMARSRNLIGPYELHPDTYILSARHRPDAELQRAGHADLVETQNGETYMVYLCGRPLRNRGRCTLGRETAIQKMVWGNDGWLRTLDGQGIPTMETPAPALTSDAPRGGDGSSPAGPQAVSSGDKLSPLRAQADVNNASHRGCRCDFDDLRLPIDFQWLRTPWPEGLFSLIARPGFLRLFGRETIGSVFRQSLVARRQQSHCFSARTVVEFEPEHFQHMAGLVCYYNSTKFHYLYISRDESVSKHLRVMTCLPDSPQADAFTPPIPIPSGKPMHLRVEVDYERLQFAYRVDGVDNDWRWLPQQFDASILSDEASAPGLPNFTGAFVGMACQDLAGTLRSADFDFFEYPGEKLSSESVFQLVNDICMSKICGWTEVLVPNSTHSMKTRLALLTLASMVWGQLCTAQTDQPADDWKPATSNQGGKQYPQVNSERRVRARVVAPQAQSVVFEFLGGAKYPLTKGDDGAWLGFTRPQDEGFHYYQLVIDGAGVPDPGSLYFYGGNRWGGGVEVPAQDQDFYAVKDVPHGQLRQTLYYSKDASAVLRCFVYTPPDYDKDLTRRYPVLYLQHGAGEDDTGWGSQGHAGLIMDNLIAEGKTKPFLIVMANSYVPGAAGPARGPGAAVATNAPSAGATNAAPTGGRGPGGRMFDFTAFTRVLINDLIPFMDANFRTLSDQPNRAMAGLSMGGMQTRTITLAHLDKFSQVGVFSGGSIALTNITDMDAFKQKVKVVFVSYGSRELEGNGGGFAGRFGGDPKANTEALKAAGVNSYFYVSADTAHEWQSWRRSLYQFAPLLFQDHPVQMAAALVATPAAAAAAAVAAPSAAATPAANILAADVTGTWKSDFDSQIGHQFYTFTFKQEGGKLNGKASSVIDDRKRETELKDGKVNGNAISFVEMLNFQDNEIRITYTGKLSANGNEIKFTREVGEFAKEEIVARRVQIIPQSRGEASAVTPAPATTAPSVAADTTPAPTAPAGPIVLQIDAGKVIGKVSPMLYGLMTEEINFAYEGGIYGELIRNRSFKADAVIPHVTPDTYEVGKYLPVTFKSDTQPRFWTVVGGASMVLDTNTVLNEFLNVSLKLDASTASAASPAGIANGGYWGIPVKPQTTYHLSFFAKAAAGFTGPVTVSLESTNGTITYASSEISGLTIEWKKFEAELKTKDVPASKDNVFKLTTTTPGTLWLQNVSLFPPTYKNRQNGYRADIMEWLAAMKPKFLRLPGGNYLEGNAFNQRFNWKETIGPVEQRPGHPSPWGYWSTDGLGLLEFAEWCEDIDMEPLLGVFAGYCLGRGGVIQAGPQLEPYVQEALEEIEYLIGDASTTKWGAQRAKDGHPEPFKMHYVEVGNEDWFDRSGPERNSTYDGRFAQFHDAIQKKYPELKVISSVGYEQPQTLWVKSRTPDLVDEHYYRGLEEMMAQSLKYDTYSRTNQSRIFCGEWATRVGSPTPNMAGALGDGAWMTCMERNSDIVLLSCYAPLFVNVSQLSGQGRSMQWSSDLIGYDALTSYGSPSYYAQMMFGTMHGDEILATDSQDIPTKQWQRRGRNGAPAPAQQIREVFFDATRDGKSGLIYLKVVNTSGSPRPINIQINGAPKIEPEGELVSLVGKSLDDTNSIEEPTKIVPRTEKADGLSASFTREFPAYSVTIMKLKAK